MKKSVKKEDSFGIILYILELQNKKYYVGITNNPEERFNKHESGETLRFVNKNLPIKSIKKALLKTTIRSEAIKLENKTTIELIEKHGIANISGGVFTGDFHDRIQKFKTYFNRLNSEVEVTFADYMDNYAE